MITKICSNCHQELDILCFDKHRLHKDGYNSVCKKCRREIRKNLQYEAREIEYYKLLSQNKKKCSQCNQILDLNSNNFTRDHTKRDGYRTICKECVKKYRERAEIKKKVQEYKNRIDVKQREKEYRSQKIVKERANANHRRYYQNVDVKIHHSISSGIRESLKSNKNGYHWEDLVGYTLQDLKMHLEKQFDVNMTWDNYGRKKGIKCWEIDHIRPKNTFNITDYNCQDFKECWALSNLRPLWMSENRSRPKDGSDII